MTNQVLQTQESQKRGELEPQADEKHEPISILNPSLRATVERFRAVNEISGRPIGYLQLSARLSQEIWSRKAQDIESISVQKPAANLYGWLIGNL